MSALFGALELASAVAVPVLAVVFAITWTRRGRRLPVRAATVLPMLIVLLVTPATDVLELAWPAVRGQHVLRAVELLIVLAALLCWLRAVAEDDVVRHELVEARAAAEERLERERLAVASAGMGTWEWDIGSNELRWSPGLESRLGLHPGSLGRTVPEHLRAVDPRDRDDLLLQLAHSAATGEDLVVTHHVLDEQGNAAHLELVGGAAADSRGQSAWVSGVVMDLDRLGQHEPTEPMDALTGMSPRWQLISQLGRMLGDADPERLAGLVLVDVRNVSDINDALGHDIGDRFLTAFAARLGGLLREDDLLARVGGCQFAVLPSGVRTKDAYASLASSILSAAEQPLTVCGAELHPVLNLGVALEAPELTAAQILQRADIAARQSRAVPGTSRVYCDTDETDRRTVSSSSVN